METELFGDLAYVKAYIDDVVIFSRSAVKHISHMTVVWERIRRTGLNLKLQKCFVAMERWKCMGILYGPRGSNPT